MPTEIFSNHNLEFAIRLFAALVCGGGIGIERTKRNKGARIKTHILVCVGATLFVILSKYGFLDIMGKEGVRVDVSRVAASVTMGVGFLGGGIIYLRGNSIQGLTTAASVWATAAIGSALGVGMYILGVSSTILIVVLQVVLHYEDALGMERTTSSRIVVVMQDDQEKFSSLKDLLHQRGIEINGIHIKKNKEASLVYTMDIRMPKNLSPSELLDIVRLSGAVKSIGM